MKYIKQFTIIMCITFLGEILHALLPLPIPASIYGLVLMLGGLMSGIIPLEAVRDTGKFLVSIMSIMFIPSGVGLIIAWDEMKLFLLPFLATVIISNITVFGATGMVTQWLIRRKAGQKND